MSVKHPLMKDRFSYILKRNNIEDPDLLDSLMNAVYECEEQSAVIDMLSKPIHVSAKTVEEEKA